MKVKKQNLNILQVTTGHEVYDNRIAKKICGYLSQNNVEVELLVKKPADYFKADDKFKITFFKRPRSRFQRLISANWHVFRMVLASKAEIIHFHDPAFIPYGIFLTYLNRKVVYDVHEDYRSSIEDREWLPKFLRKIAKKIVISLEKWMSNRGYVIAATPKIAEYFPASRTETVQNYPIVSLYNNMPFERRPKEFVYVGSMSLERGLDVVIDALDIVNSRYNGNIKLNLIGDIDNDLHEYLAGKPGWSNVRIHGRLPAEEVVEFLGSSYCGLVLLSDIKRYRESKPTKIYEYMMSGTPFIASDFYEWRKLFGEDVGLYCSVNKTSLADSMVYLLENTNIAKKMSETAVKVSNRNYTFATEGQKLLSFYRMITDVHSKSDI